MAERDAGLAGLADIGTSEGLKCGKKTGEGNPGGFQKQPEGELSRGREPVKGNRRRAERRFDEELRAGTRTGGREPEGG